MIYTPLPLRAPLPSRAYPRSPADGRYTYTVYFIHPPSPAGGRAAAWHGDAGRAGSACSGAASGTGGGRDARQLKEIEDVRR